MKLLTVIFFLFASSASAQNNYAAPTQAQWDAMIQALQNVPMSVTSHQQVMQIMQAVQQQAAAERMKKEKVDAK